MRRIRRLVACAMAATMAFFSLLLSAGAEETGAKQAGDEHSPLPGMDAVVSDILTIDIAAIPVWRMVIAAMILLVGIMMRTTILKKVLAPLQRLAAKTKTTVDDQLLEGIQRPLGWLVNLIAIYFAVLLLQVPEALYQTTVLILQTMGTVFVAWMVFNVVDAFGAYFQELARKTDSDIDDHLVPLVKRVLRIILVIVTIVTIIQQWGYDVTSLIAGLGLGGLAFALAAQSTLSNWFGSVKILTDRPFSVGDLIDSPHGGGTIVDVGMNSTRIWTFKGTLITVPNADMASVAITNYNDEPIMNLQAEIKLVYGTTREELERIMQRLRELMVRAEGVDHERSLVCFNGFGPSSLDILLHVFIAAANWAEWHARRGELLLEVLSELEKEGAEFAYPTQSLLFETPLDLRKDKVGAGSSGAIDVEPAL